MIYDSLKKTVSLLQNKLPEFTQVKADFSDSDVEQIFVSSSHHKSKYNIVISLSEYDTIVSFDCRVESAEGCEYEFDHSCYTLSETIDKAIEWINDNESGI